MKKCIIVLVLFFVGCSSPYFFSFYQLGTPLIKTVGSTVMSWETGVYHGAWKAEAGREGLRKELIYNGIAQNVLQFGYREYYVGPNGTFARSAFNEELRYDITTSKRITYRDVIIDIESADAQTIRYTIVKGPDEIELNKNRGQ